MPPKPTKDLKETLQSILNKLANLQTQLRTTQEHHEGCYLALHQAMETHQTALELKQDTLTSYPHWPIHYLVFSNHQSSTYY